MRLKGQKIDLKMGSPKEKQILQQRVHDTSWVLQNLPSILFGVRLLNSTLRIISFTLALLFTLFYML